MRDFFKGVVIVSIMVLICWAVVWISQNANVAVLTIPTYSSTTVGSDNGVGGSLGPVSVGDNESSDSVSKPSSSSSESWGKIFGSSSGGGWSSPSYSSSDSFSSPSSYSSGGGWDSGGSSSSSSYSSSGSSSSGGWD